MPIFSEKIISQVYQLKPICLAADQEKEQKSNVTFQQTYTAAHISYTDPY